MMKAPLKVVALWLAITSQCAVAQTTESTQAAEPQSDSPSSAIENIIVTAQRREERLQDVPITVNAFSAEQLQRQGTTKMLDMAQVVPGLSIAKSSGAVQIYLRGVGNPTIAPGNDPSIATYIDGVYNATPSAILFSFNNLDRIEVLKGPQGTLFGRNATGGLINMITRDPTSELTASARLGYGRFNALETAAYISGGSDTVAADLSVFYNNQESGWGKNVFNPATAGTVLVNGAPITLPSFSNVAGYLRDYGVRSKVVFTPGDRTKVKLSGTYVDTNGDQNFYRHGLPGAILSGDNQTPFVYTGDFYDYNSDVPWRASSHQSIVSVDATHEANFATLKSITSYQSAYTFSFQPSDSTPQVNSSQSISNAHTTAFTQELQLLSNPDAGPNWLEYTLGLYFLSSEGKYDPVSTVRGYNIETSMDRFSSQETDSYAAYGQATAHLTSTTRLTGGLRYSQDEITGQQYLIGTNTSTIPAPAATARAGQVSSIVTPQSKTFDEVTWRIALDQRLTSDILAFASYNRGYKVGAWNHGAMCGATPPVGQACAVILPPVKPEILDSYEVGIKSDLLDNRLRINLSAYYYDYKDLQVQAVVGQPPVSLLTNAADSRIYGADLEMIAVVTNDFRLTFNGGYLDAKYTSFPGAPVNVPRTVAPYGNATVTIDASDNRMIKTPEFTSTLAMDWTIPTPIGEFDLTGSWSHNSGFFWEASNRVKQSAYDLFNAQISYQLPDEHWTVRLWGKNLSGEKYLSNTSITAFGDQGAPAAPLTFGATIEWKY